MEKPPVREGITTRAWSRLALPDRLDHAGFTNALVLGHERQAVGQSSSDDQPIGGVANDLIVERAAALGR
jgi:hypothetical protein